MSEDKTVEETVQETVETVETVQTINPVPVAQEIVEESIEVISEEELAAIRVLREKEDRCKLDFERARAVLRASTLELNNVILQIYNKYKLSTGIDTIQADGTIIRVKQ